MKTFKDQLREAQKANEALRETEREAKAAGIETDSHQITLLLDAAYHFGYEMGKLEAIGDE